MEFYFTILLFAVSTTITPGPNNIMIMASGLNYGIKKSTPHLLGICFGFPAMVILFGLGFSVIFEKYPLLHEIIKVHGVIYLLYLAWLIAASSPSSLDSKKTQPLSFTQAAFFNGLTLKHGLWQLALYLFTPLFQLMYLCKSVMLYYLSFFYCRFSLCGYVVIFWC